jgi:hypothetical protein
MRAFPRNEKGRLITGPFNYAGRFLLMIAAPASASPHIA